MTDMESKRRSNRQSILPQIDRNVLLGMLIFVEIMFIVTWLASRDFMPGAKLFPGFIAGLGAVITVIALIRVWMGVEPSLGPGQVLPDPDVSSWPAYRFAGIVLASICIYYLSILLVGFMPATFLYLVAFARFHDQSWLSSLIGGVAALVFVYGMSLLFGLYLPWGILFEGLL